MSPMDVSLPPEAKTAGQMLRAARERKGMHLALLSVNLKVSVAQLEALEADRYEAFKGTAFVRALALSVCRQLKIDPTAVMAALPQSNTPVRLEPTALEVRQRPSGVDQASTPAALAKGLNRQVLLLATLMLLGAAVLIWWPEQAKQSNEAVEQSQELHPAPMPMVEASDVTPLPATAVAASAPPLTPAPAMAASAAPASATEAAVRTPALTADAGASPLVLEMTGDAWVSIRDKTREVLLKRQVKAGETVELLMQAPFFVYVSRADAVQLRWQGQRMDLKPHTQNNEVRLSIKP